jgi:hypothetical protein
MSNFYLPGTKHTPEVDFRYSEHRLSLKGECFPENAVKFFSDLMNRTQTYLSGLKGQMVEVNVQLTYFNSASTKLLFKMIADFDAASQAGNLVTINWYYDEEDDTLEDFGRDIEDEYTSLKVEMHALTSL